jgi:hypothetical protein
MPTLGSMPNLGLMLLTFPFPLTPMDYWFGLLVLGATISTLALMPTLVPGFSFDGDGDQHQLLALTFHLMQTIGSAWPMSTLVLMPMFGLDFSFDTYTDYCFGTKDANTWINANSWVDTNSWA